VTVALAHCNNDNNNDYLSKVNAGTMGAIFQSSCEMTDKVIGIFSDDIRRLRSAVSFTCALL